MTEPYLSLETNLGKIRSALSSGLNQEALLLLRDLHPADQAEIFERLEESEKKVLLSLLDLPTTADILEELEDGRVLDTVESLTLEHLADLLDEMEPDEAADLLGDLPPGQVKAILAEMEDSEEVVPLLGYPDETAGGLMTTWFIALRRDTLAEDAISYLRRVSPDTTVPYYLYVIDQEQRLIGVVGLRQLVIAKPDTRMEEIMDPESISVEVGADQEEAARIMARYDLATLPVVDKDHRIVGVITHDDIVDVLDEEATEDIYRLGNVTDTELQPESPTIEHMKGRLPWLYLNMVTALFASWVIANYEDLIAEVAILAAFTSIVAGLGGNSATQNVVMIVRAQALGRIDGGRFWRVLQKQVLVGLLQGLAVGVVVGAGVALWQSNLYLGVVLGLAMVGNMVIAGIVGTLVPFAIAVFGKDPALASTVLVTAGTDVLGFFIFLSLAAQFLPLLR